MQYIILKQLLDFLGMSAALGFGGLLYGVAVVRDLKTILKATNDSAILSKQNDLVALKKLCEFIELHATIKELSDTNYI